VSTIVVGYDGHESSDRALDRAIEAARDANAKLVVLSVFELPFNPEGPQNFASIEPNEVDFLPLDEPPPELEPTLARARARVEAAGLEADYEWAAGDPADSIVGTARDRSASLVVLGAHEHSWLGRLVGSDVAKEVRDRVDCEVEAV
jgi:nucleotide-binding universal stress UspA family protein